MHVCIPGSASAFSLSAMLRYLFPTLPELVFISVIVRRAGVFESVGGLCRLPRWRLKALSLEARDVRGNECG